MYLFFICGSNSIYFTYAFPQDHAFSLEERAIYIHIINLLMNMYKYIYNMNIYMVNSVYYVIYMNCIYLPCYLLFIKGKVSQYSYSMKCCRIQDRIIQ